MDEGGFRNNYIFTLIKLALFLIIFCFLIELTREFWQELRTRENFSLNVLVTSILFTFAFNTFFADLNGYYGNIQRFFFRSSFFPLLIPSLLVALSVGYFFLPKILNINIDRNIFIFLGGFTFTTHLTFIARQTKGHNFVTLINYLFIFSILYILNLILLGMYLKLGFRLYVGRVIAEGIKGGAGIIQSLFAQILR